MKREDLLKNNGYWISKIQFKLYDELLDYLKKKNINKTQLAKELGVSKGYISQILNGDFNHKISKLVELSLAINKIPKLEFIDVDEFINEESEGTKTISWKLKQTPKSNITCTDTYSSGNEKTAVPFEDSVEPYYVHNNS